MTNKLEEISEENLNNLTNEVRGHFYELMNRLDRLSSDMANGFESLNYQLTRLNYNIESQWQL